MIGLIVCHRRRSHCRRHFHPPPYIRLAFGQYLVVVVGVKQEYKNKLLLQSHTIVIMTNLADLPQGKQGTHTDAHNMSTFSLRILSKKTCLVT